MKRWLLCAGVDGSESALKPLKHIVEERRPDGVLFLGGILRPHEQQPTGLGRKDLVPEEARLYAGFFETLDVMDVFTAIVPGTFDVPLREFLHLGMGAEVQNHKTHLAHTTLVTGHDYAIAGIGGQLTEWVDTGEYQVRLSRSTAEYHLRMFWRVEKSRKILLLGSPPAGPLGGSGEEGQLAAELIDSYHPHLCAVGGATEHRGTHRVASTTIVNPGRLVDGSAAWIDWTRPRNQQAEILDLRRAGVAG